MIFYASALLISTNAYAGMETDKAVGNCIAYFAAAQKLKGMQAALELADNQKRALKYSEMQMNEFHRYKNNKSALQGSIYSASGDCREIGIRTSDY